MSHILNIRHTITIKNDVYLRLKDSGKFGESFSDVISRLLVVAQKPGAKDVMEARK
jgi:predicted CopG family antitoxin